MQLSDSRTIGGIIPIIQHHGYDRDGWRRDLRSCMLVARVYGRAQGPDDVGQYRQGERHTADLTGCFLWPNDKRENPAASWLFPVTTTDETRKQPKLDFPPVSPASPVSQLPKLAVLKHDAKKNEWARETLLDVVEATVPERDKRPLWPRFPKGDFFGLAVQAQNEEAQFEQFHPTDPRLIAVNKAGDWRIGSWLCDLDDKDKIDIDRTAPLQAMMRVIKEPRSHCAPIFPAIPGDPNQIDFQQGKRANAIAWNIGFSGQGDTHGGLVHDAANASSALVSRTWYGFIVSDDKKHNVGVDADGKSINQAALALDANFSYPGGVWSAPLKHDGLWKGAGDAPFDTLVYFEYDRGIWHPYSCGIARGKHRWRAKSFFSRIPPVTPPPSVPPPDLPPPRIPIEFPPTGKEIEPVGVPGNGGGGIKQPRESNGAAPAEEPEGDKPSNGVFIGRFNSRGEPLDDRGRVIGHSTAPAIPKNIKVRDWRVGEDVPITGTIWPLMLGGILGRAQHFHTDSIDYAQLESPTREQVAKFNQTAPVVICAEFIAAQASGSFDYTQSPKKQKFIGGTADGMLTFFPPERDARDYAMATVPSRTVSSPCIGLEYNICLRWFDSIDWETGKGFGGPVFSTSGSSGSRNLDLDFLDASGAARMGKFTVNGNLLDVVGSANAFFSAYAGANLRSRVGWNGANTVLDNRGGSSGGRLQQGGGSRLVWDDTGVWLIDGIYFGWSDVRLTRAAANVLALAAGDVMRFDDGTAGAPVMAFTNSTDTGVFLPTTGAIGFAAAGTERARISATALSPAGATMDLGAVTDPWEDGFFNGDVSVGGKLTVTGLIDPTGLVLEPQAASPADNCLWVKTGTPTVLMFTDSAGADFTVNVTAV